MRLLLWTICQLACLALLVAGIWTMSDPRRDRLFLRRLGVGAALFAAGTIGTVFLADAAFRDAIESAHN